MRISLPARRIVVACAALMMTAGVAACSSDEAGTSPASTSSSVAPQTVDVAALKARLPERVRTSGTLIVGTNAPFAPMEFEQDGELTGFDIDLVEAIAQTLELKTDIRQSPFPQLLPDVQSGAVDMAARGLFDTRSREQLVDMVTYMRAGTQWAQRTGSGVEPENACGKKVGAEADTVQLTVELPAKSQACEAVGEERIDVVAFDSEQAAMDGLLAGEVDAVSADSPVIRYSARRSGGRIEAVDNAFDTQPYAFPVAKGSPLGPVLQQVIQHLIDTGEMKALADRWGLQGLIATSTVNAAIN